MPLLPRRFERLKSVLNHRMADLTVLLEHVEKPHNLSAILRSCDAVGALEAHAVSFLGTATHLQQHRAREPKVGALERSSRHRNGDQGSEGERIPLVWHPSRHERPRLSRLRFHRADRLRAGSRKMGPKRSSSGSDG